MATACSPSSAPACWRRAGCFPIPLNRPELFTATPRWQQFIRDDPLGLREATARLLFESVRLDGYLRFVPRHVRVPVLLLLAEKDRIIHNAPTRAYVQRFASSDQQVIEYPGAHHTLEFEPDPDRFIDDLQRWLETGRQGDRASKETDGRYHRHEGRTMSRKQSALQSPCHPCLPSPPSP